MTENEFLRADQITHEISNLKYALAEANKMNLFRTNDAASCTRTDDPFLSELSIELRSLAVKKINARIASLEKEFKAL